MHLRQKGGMTPRELRILQQTREIAKYRVILRVVAGPPRAKRYLADGGYLWNSGIFVFRVDVILDEIVPWIEEQISVGQM